MSPPPSDHGDIATMRFEEYIFAFLFISGHGDIFPERFEEYLLDYHGTHLNWLWRIFPCPPHMELGPLVTVVASYLFSSRLSLHFYAVFIHLRCNHLLEYLYMVGILFPVHWSTVSLPHSG